MDTTISDQDWRLIADYVTVQEFAEATNRRPSSIRRSIERGTIEAYKKGRDWMIEGSELRRRLSNQEKGLW